MSKIKKKKQLLCQTKYRDKADFKCSHSVTINWGKSTLWWLSRNLGGYYRSWRRSHARTLLNRTETRKGTGWTIFTHYHQRKTLHKGCSVLQVLLSAWKWSRIVGNLQFLIKEKCICKAKAPFSNLNNLMTPNLNLGAGLVSLTVPAAIASVWGNGVLLWYF